MRNTLKQAVVLWGMVLLLVLWSVFISPSGVLRWAGAAAIVLAVAALLIYRRRQAWTEMTGDAGLSSLPPETYRQPVLRAIRDYRPPEQKMEVTASLQAQTVRLDSMSLFDVGQARLKDGSTKVLVDALVNIRAKPGWLILVAGYTDATGDEKSNQQLSLRRAEAVRNWMLQTSDIPATCFAVQGLGESQPAATNDTPQGRAVNRRVEISLVPRSDACQDVK
ncbi:OmpA family protein [Escherichia coli]